LSIIFIPYFFIIIIIIYKIPQCHPNTVKSVSWVFWSYSHLISIIY